MNVSPKGTLEPGYGTGVRRKLMLLAFTHIPCGIVWDPGGVKSWPHRGSLKIAFITGCGSFTREGGMGILWYALPH